MVAVAVSQDDIFNLITVGSHIILQIFAGAARIDDKSLFGGFIRTQVFTCIGPV